ncbi:MAG TPA: hypothetical protein VD864_00875 [Nocardioides sp.]|nr:hypothetical protein [Nocardioides sp.]
MDPLATVGDLGVRGVDVTNLALAEEMLAVASASVRGAAGSPISRVTSTITYTGWAGSPWLILAGQPVVAVSAVSVDGRSVSDWRLADGRLWRRSGWGPGYDSGPTTVDVTQTHGLLVVPADIVNLVCDFAAAGIDAANEGGGNHVGKVAERIGDYSVTYAQGAEAVASVMEIPAGTRQWLSAMFGGSAAVVSTRS